MRVGFRAMHLLAQGKKGLSRRLQHKLMQAMLERDRRYQLGAAAPRIEIDDAYVGGERSGEGSGRPTWTHALHCRNRDVRMPTVALMRPICSGSTR